MERVIETEDDLAEGAAHLRATCPRLAGALELCPDLPLRRRPEGFTELLWVITGQQVSVASHAALWSRLQAAGLTGAGAVAAANDAELRAAGLSRQKARYAKALAAARIDYAGLAVRPTADVIATLTEVSGIGRWTAEIYAMFSLGRADAFAAGDLALQEAARMLYDLPERPTERRLREIATPWTPFRSVAARLLWAYYRVAKDREGIG